MKKNEIQKQHYILKTFRIVFIKKELKKDELVGHFNYTFFQVF